VVECVGDTKTGGEGDKNKVAPVVGLGGADIKGSFAMSCPRLPLFSGVVDDDELSWGMDGVGGKVVGERCRPCQVETEGSKEKRRKWLIKG
jgi:hypothetical protein